MNTNSVFYKYQICVWLLLNYLACSQVLIQEKKPSEAQQQKEQIHKEIGELIEELNSDNLAVREEATKRLIEIGKQNPALVKKALSQLSEYGELEVRVRAKHILDEIPWQSYKRIGYGRIMDFAFYSPTQLVVVSNDHMIRLWDVQSQELIKSVPIEEKLRESLSKFTCRALWSSPLPLKLSPSGKILLLFEGEELLHLVKPFTGKNIRSLILNKNSTTYISRSYPPTEYCSHYDTYGQFSPDENLLAIYDEIDDTIKIWNLKHAKVEKVIDSQSLHRLCFISDTQLLASCALEGKAIVLDINTGKEVNVLKREKHKNCGPIAVSPDKKFLVLTSWDGSQELKSPIAAVEIYDLSTWTKIATLPGTFITSVSFSPDSKFLALVDKEYVKVIDVNSWQLFYCIPFKRVYPAWVGPILELKGETRIRFSSDGNFLAFLYNDTIKILDMRTKKQKALVRGYQTDGNLCFSLDSKLLATETKIWDLQSGQEIKIFEDASKLFLFTNEKFIRILENTIETYDIKRWEKDKEINFNHNVENNFFISAWGNKVYFIDSDSAAILKELKISRDGKLLVMISHIEGEIDIVDLGSGTIFKTLKWKGRGYINSFDLSPDTNLLCTGTNEGIIGLWDIKSGKLIQELQIASKDKLIKIFFSFDGKRLIAAIGEEEGDKAYTLIKLFDVMGKEIKLIEVDNYDRGIYYPEAISSDNKLFCSRDNEIVIIDIITKKIKEIDTSFLLGKPRAICVSPNGNLVATSFSSGVIQIWQK